MNTIMSLEINQRQCQVTLLSPSVNYISSGIAASFYPGFEYDKPETTLSPDQPFLRSNTVNRRPSTLPLPKSSKNTPPGKTRNGNQSRSGPSLSGIIF